MDFDQILNITRTLALPALAGLFWLWRQVFQLRKDIIVLEQKQNKLTDKIENLPGHKDNQKLLEAIRALDKTMAVNRESLQGDLKAMRAEIKTELKTLKEISERHEHVIRGS